MSYRSEIIVGPSRTLNAATRAVPSRRTGPPKHFISSDLFSGKEGSGIAESHHVSERSTIPEVSTPSQGRHHARNVKVLDLYNQQKEDVQPKPRRVINQKSSVKVDNMFGGEDSQNPDLEFVNIDTPEKHQ
jgi:hypothetical protein